jgi:hypothetical protein
MLGRMLLLLAGAAMAAEAPWSFAAGQAPELTIVDGVATAVVRAGAVLSGPQQTILADAVRLQRRRDAWALWAEGGIVLVQPGIHLRAATLGLGGAGRRPDQGRAEAVVLWAAAPQGRTVRAAAASAELSGERIVLREVDLDLGHGGLVSVRAETVVVHLRPLGPDGAPVPRARWRSWLPEPTDVLHERLDGVEIQRATIRAAGLPVLWLPWAWRDLTGDWPWTSYDGGSSRRLGWFVRALVGSDLPEVLGWRPRLVVGGDQTTAAGWGWTVRGRARGPAGQVDALWHERPREEVRGGADQRDGLQQRRARLADLRLRHRLPGGALAAQWTSVPGPDPVAPDGTVASAERFRADHARPDLDRLPLARRGVAAAWGLSWAEFGADTVRNPHASWRTPERWWRVDAVLPRIALATLADAVVTAEGAAAAQELRQPGADTRATYLDAVAGLAAVRWIGAWGVDTRLLGRGRSLSGIRLEGAIREDDPARVVADAEAGLSLRLVHRGGTDDTPVWWRLTPRLGLEASSPGRGDRLPDLPLGVPVFTDDARWLVTGARVARLGGDLAWRADLTARWAVRDRERSARRPDGDRAEAPTALALLDAAADGNLGTRLAAGGVGRYDARLGAWTLLDAWAWWQAIDRVRLRSAAHLDTAAVDGRRFAWGPGVRWDLARYRVDAAAELRPDGRWYDGWRLVLTRHMVDGDLTGSIAWDYGPDGRLVDRRIGIGLSLGGSRDGEAP